MLIALGQYGQLCNRLFAYANLYAFALEHRLVLKNPGFWDYAHLFPKVQNGGGVKRLSFLLHKKLYAVARRVSCVPFLSIGETEGYNLEDEQNADRLIDLSRFPFAYLEGFYFLDNASFVRHAEAIRVYFRPRESVLIEVGNLVTHCRQNSSIVIGVHIRLGDYRSFMGGEFCFDWEQYREVMAQCERLFSPCEVSFLMVSNEAIPMNVFDGFAVQCGVGTADVDLFSLAKCDYIVGPSSTYSQWASFYGKVPRFVMMRGKMFPEEREEFKIHISGFGRWS